MQGVKRKHQVGARSASHDAAGCGTDEEEGPAPTYSGCRFQCKRLSNWYLEVISMVCCALACSPTGAGPSRHPTGNIPGTMAPAVITPALHTAAAVALAVAWLATPRMHARSMLRSCAVMCTYGKTDACPVAMACLHLSLTTCCDMPTWTGSIVPAGALWVCDQHGS